MAKNKIFLLCIKKVGALDFYLPLAMELEHRFNNIRFYTIFPNVDSHKYFIVNPDLVAGLERLKSKIIVINDQNKIKRIISVINLLIRMLFSNNIIIKYNDTLPRHKSLMTLTRRFGKVTELFAGYSTVSLSSYKRIQMSREIVSKRRLEKKTTNRASMYFDYCLKSLNYPFPGYEEKTIFLGYPRNFQSWFNFTNRIGEDWLKEVKTPYCFYVLSCMHKRNELLDEPSGYTMLCETLEVLKKFKNEMHTVFRPAPITNMDDFYRAIETVDFTNYSVSYRHPYIISMGAVFVIANAPSTIQADSNFLGRPTIDYFQYDSEVAESLDHGSEFIDIIDYFIPRDPNKLEMIIKSILNSDSVVVKNDDKSKKFPRTPAEFWEFWKKIFKDNRVETWEH